ncbi:MAG TPA: hypothetical protein VI585_24880, partial [Candidatus Binatia bacterium]
VEESQHLLGHRFLKARSPEVFSSIPFGHGSYRRARILLILWILHGSINQHSHMARSDDDRVIWLRHDSLPAG